MPTSMILPGGGVGGWRQGKAKLESVVSLALSEGWDFPNHQIMCGAIRRWGLLGGYE